MTITRTWSVRTSALAGLLALGACTASDDADTAYEPIPTRGLRSTPFEPSLSVSFAQLELGYGHTCGLAADGRAFCMGDHQYAQLGTSEPMRRCQGGAQPCSQTPLPVDGGHAFVQLGLDQRHSCGLTANGEVYCWGFGEGGQLGDGLRTNSQAPVRVQTSARFRFLGRGQSSGNLCAIAEGGQLYCWGIGGDGQGGNGTLDVAPAPTPVASNLAFRAVGSGQGFACALAESGDIYCWGRNNYGRLGTGQSGATTVPALVAGGLKYAALAVGGQHACGLAVDGSAHCWGFAPSVGSTAPVDGATRPQPVAGRRSYRAITAGFQHTCAIDTTDQAWCWGPNLGGALGDGSTTDRIAPVPIASSQTIASPSAGGTGTCGITRAGRLLCWGTNAYGQLGFEPGDP